jgi:peroxiredoxin Q/BCP
MLKVGEKAPDFEATTAQGDRVKLSDFVGKKNLVLFFYPKDDSPGCTREACYFRDTKAEFKRKDTVILGVSLDTEASHQRFQEKHSLNFPLISDRGKELSHMFGVLRLGGLLLLKRVTFVIDRAGIIRKVIRSETNMHTHVDRALEALDNLKG